MHLNNSFQFLNNIAYISIHFFTHTYFQKIQITLFKQHYQMGLTFLELRVHVCPKKCVCMLAETLLPDKIDGPTSNGHNSLIGCLLSNETNLTKRLFVVQKLWSKLWANIIFQNCFQSDLNTFELWLPLKYWELFNYSWLMYVKLITGARDQRFLTGTNEVSTNGV